jgi:hypothetical protein
VLPPRFFAVFSSSPRYIFSNGGQAIIGKWTGIVDPTKFGLASSQIFFLRICASSFHVICTLLKFLVFDGQAGIDICQSLNSTLSCELCVLQELSSGDEGSNYYDATDGTESDDDESVPKPSGEAKISTSGLPTRRCAARKHCGETTGTHVQSKPCKKRKRRATRARQPLIVTMPQAGDTLPVEIIFTQTVVDVVWQVSRKFHFCIIWRD